MDRSLYKYASVNYRVLAALQRDTRDSQFRRHHQVRLRGRGSDNVRQELSSLPLSCS